MLSPKEKAEKMRKAPSNSTRFFRFKTPEEKEQYRQKAAEHATAGMSSTDEYAYQRSREVNGK